MAQEHQGYVAMLDRFSALLRLTRQRAINHLKIAVNAGIKLGRGMMNKELHNVRHERSHHGRSRQAIGLNIRLSW